MLSLTLVSLSFLVPQAPRADGVPRLLTAADAREDLALLREVVELVHPGLGRYEPAEDFRRAADALDERLADGATDLEVYRELSLLTARLRCGHTRVEEPAWLEAWRERHPTQLPFTFRIFDGRMFVDAASADSGLARGTEVLSIEGRPVAELIEAIGATVPIDGWTDGIRASRLEAAYEFSDPGLDHYLPMFLGGEDPLRERFELEVRAPGAANPERRSVPGLTRAGQRALGPVASDDLVDAVSWSRLDERTALLAVGTFVNYRRPIDAEALFARVFGEIRAAGCERLVLDLRACGGGSGDVGWTLARFLVQQPFEVGGPRRVKTIHLGELKAFLSTWDPSALEPPEEAFEREPDGWYRILEPLETLEPHAERFRGRATVLIGPYNASGATMLLAKLHELDAIRTVGEPTGGSAEGPTAGLIFFLALPHSGLRVNVPAVRESTGLRRFEKGQGVEPDVRVIPTLADFLAERDPVLEAALALDAGGEARADGDVPADER